MFKESIFQNLNLIFIFLDIIVFCSIDREVCLNTEFFCDINIKF